MGLIQCGWEESVLYQNLGQGLAGAHSDIHDILVYQR